MKCRNRKCDICYPRVKEKKVPATPKATTVAEGYSSVSVVDDPKRTVTLEFGTGSAKVKVKFDEIAAEEAKCHFEEFLDKY